MAIIQGQTSFWNQVYPCIIAIAKVVNLNVFHISDYDRSEKQVKYHETSSSIADPPSSLQLSCASGTDVTHKYEIFMKSLPGI